MIPWLCDAMKEATKPDMWDIISTGTPGAVVISDGDTAECRIDGMGVLRNPVRRVS